LLSTFVQNGFPRDRIEALPYGLAPDRVAAIPVQRPRKPLRLAFCGVLSPWKAPHLVIDAVRSSSADVALSIHGRVDEPMFQGYIDDCRARAAGDARIAFCGPYRHEDAGRVFADMDALVVPSVWYENTPFVVLEAFMAGVPVIASDLGGLSESVRDGENGLLFRAGDASSLRAAIERMAGDPDLCARLLPKAPPTVADGYDRFRRAYAQR
jgi:glycosyltransferase involved in cell wall biosynthesis